MIEPPPTPEDYRVAKQLRRRRRVRSTLIRLSVAVVAVGAVAGAIALDLPDRLAEALGPVQPVAAPPVAPALAAAPIAVPAGVVSATVDSVHDGDTLFLMLGGERVKVRLLAVDTPEIGDNLECFGNESTAYLRHLLPEGSTVSTLADVEPYDQYDRALLFVWTPTGTLVNHDLVASGYAEAVFIGGNRMFETEVEAAEDAAQAAGLGIWGAC